MVGRQLRADSRCAITTHSLLRAALPRSSFARLDKPMATPCFRDLSCPGQACVIVRGVPVSRGTQADQSSAWTCHGRPGDLSTQWQAVLPTGGTSMNEGVVGILLGALMLGWFLWKLWRR